MPGDATHNNNGRRAFLASLPALTLLAGGCQLSQPGALRLGFNPWPGYELFKLAEQLGYYRELGLDLQLVEFTSLGDSRRAFERQQIDVAAGTAVELLTAGATLGQPVQAFCLTNLSVGADYLIAHPSLERLESLKGRKVAVEPGSLNLLLLHLALASAGMKLQEVQMLPMAQASMPGAFQRGEVDAVVVYPPVADDLLAQGPGKARVLFDSSRVPDAIIDLLYARRELIEQRPGELAALVRGFEMAREYTVRHPDDAYARMAARTGRQRDDFERDMGGLKLLPLAEQAPLFEPGGRVDLTLFETLQALRDGGMTLEMAKSGLATPAILRRSLQP